MTPGEDWVHLPNRRETARQRGILARRFPCRCRGAGCAECGGRGHLYDQRTFAQTVNLMPSTVPPHPKDDLPWE